MCKWKRLKQARQGNFKYTKEDQILQERLRKIFHRRSFCHGFKSRMGALFLRKNKELLK